MKTYTLKFVIILLLSTLVFSGCSEDSTEDSTGTDDTDYPIVSNETYISTSGFEWQAPSYPYTGTWQEAIDYCETLSWAGYTDWKLPALENIYLDYENFSQFRSGIYWSAKESTIDSAYALALWGGENEPAQDGSFLKTDPQSAYCVRGSLDTYYTQNPSIQGRWAYVASGEVVIIDSNTYLTFKEKIDDNHITITDDNDDTLHLIRAGIANVKLKGEIATVSGSGTLSISRGASSIGGLDLILTNAAQDEERVISVVSTTDDTIIGTITPATETTNEILYVADPATTNDRVVIPENSELTMPTGNTQITVVESDNNATFNVSVIGEETDMGILTVTDQAYNFKSYIENGNDWRYFGYNDGEDAISYTKALKICNIGTEDISGVSFVITLDSNARDINRTFSTDYDGSAVPFTSGECKEYTASFSFTRPLEDRDVKINILIKNNFNALIWNDYTSLKVSQYPHHNLYFNSNTKTLNGILVTPGRNLINVEFSDWAYNNYVRVPLVQTDEYNVIISTPNITDEDVYMISSGKEPDTTKMDGFTAVLTNEPDNNTSAATQIALFEGESVAYLHKGDIDFYKIVDKPKVASTMPANAFVDFNISIPITTEMNSSTITTSTVSLSYGSIPISGTVSYDESTKTILFAPDTNLTAGVHTISMSGDLQSATGYKLESDLSFDINILDYPVNAQIIGSYTTNGANKVSVTKNYAYVSGSFAGLQIVDISDPSSPILKASLDTPGDASDVSLSGDYAYVSDTASGLQVIDISNPNSLTLKATLDTSGYANGVSVSGDYAYIADSSSGLQIVDISDPSSPTLKATLTTSGDAKGVSILGNYAYLADGYGGLRIIDISDPSVPVLKATQVSSGYANGVSISGDYAYVAIGSSGLQILDISSPTSPIQKGTLSITGNANGIIVSGNYAYLSDSASGLHIIDISDPSSPSLISTINTSGDANGVTVFENFAYVADGNAGMKIINIQMYQ